MIVACSCCMGDSVLAREWPMGFLHNSLVGVIQNISVTPSSLGDLSSSPSVIPYFTKSLVALTLWNPLPAHFTTLEIMILGGLEPIPAWLPILMSCAPPLLS